MATAMTQRSDLSTLLGPSHMVVGGCRRLERHESMKDMDPDLRDPQRRHFTMHWRGAREKAKGVLGGGS
jgi:hypothetical protein